MPHNAIHGAWLPATGPWRLPDSAPSDPAILFSSYDVSPFAVCVTDTDLDAPGPHLVYVNPAFCHQTGYSAAELLGRSPRMFQGPRSDRAVLDRVRSDLLAGRVFVGQTVNYRRDGSTYVVRWTIVPAERRGRAEYYIAFQQHLEPPPALVSELTADELRILGERVLETASVGVAVTDEAGRLVSVNPSFAELLSRQPGDFAGREIGDILGPAFDRTAYENFLAGIEWEPGTHANAGRTIEIRINRVGLESRILGVWYLYDVTERTAAQAALAASELKFRTVLSRLSEAITLVDRQGKRHFISDAVTRVLGYTVEELIGGDAFDIVHPDDIPRVGAVFAQSMQEPDQEVAVEFRGRHKDGHWIDLELRGRSHHDDPALGYGVASVRDVTERNRAVRELAEKELRLRTLGDNLPGGGVYQYIHGGDGSQGMRYVSRGFETITGRSAAEFLDGRADIFQFVHADDLPRAHEAVVASISGVRPLDIRVRTLDTGDVVCDGMLMDVTERVRLEEQFLQAQKMESLGQLAGGVAHDFNNLLTVILGNLDLLPKPATQAGQTLLDSVRTAAGRASELTQKLLGFSRRRPLQPQPIDVGAILADTAAMLRRVLDPRIVLRVERASELPKARGDAGAVQQAILNLCLNARDAMPKGGLLQLGVEATDYPVPPREAKPGLYLTITVEDDGRGMDPATLKRLFEPFFTTKPTGQGTGLGLPMVYGTIKQHGGWIDVNSTPGRGTKFVFTLPAVPASAAAKTVWIVDDEPAVRMVARAMLETHGFAVYEFESADAALVASASGPALVLLDQHMAGLGFTAALQGFRKRFPAARIILCSGSVPDDATQQAVDAVLLKPFRSADLLAVVHTAPAEG
jgi:two-component system, cell cycle sensor histidine kinase and response regulator CckA